MTENNKLSGKVIPVLSIKNAKSAIALYEKVLDAKILEIHFDKENENIVMHAEIQIHESSVFINDVEACNSKGKNVPSNVALYIYTNYADYWFNKAVKNGMEISIPLEDMFWGHRFGSAKDKYGIQWCFSNPLKK